MFSILIPENLSAAGIRSMVKKYSRKQQYIHT